MQKKLIMCRFGLVSAFVLILLIGSGIKTIYAQQPVAEWSMQERIPDLRVQQRQLVLIADQNRTVHALNHQEIDQGVEGIVYNQWTLEQRWTSPIDVIWPPEKGIARVLGGFLDQNGIIHVAFFSGDEVGGNIYYAYVPAIDAHRASAWSKPELVGRDAMFVGSIAGDSKGNIVIIYGGKTEGNGMYGLLSTDHGYTWSDTQQILPTYDEELVPFWSNLQVGPSGYFHAVWSFVNQSGQGVAGYYANFSLETGNWDNIEELDETFGLGIRTPSVIEYKDQVIVTYYNWNENTNWWRKSDDLGRTWSPPSKISARHKGANGPTSLVIDNKRDLHIFFGQRIDDLNHGIWHSMWNGLSWNEPQAIKSGPLSDLPGQEFDPHSASAVISQGNVALVAWTTDAKVEVFDVWYSYTKLDAPELPVVPLSAVTTPTPIPTVDPTATPVPPIPSHRPAAPVTAGEANSETLSENPSAPLILGLVPVTLLIVVTVIVNRVKR